MSRSVKSEPLSLPELEEWEMQAITEFLRCGSKVDAFSKYSEKTKSWSRESLYVAASRFFARSDIRLTTTLLRDRRMHEAGVSLVEHVQSLMELRDEARQGGNLNAAVVAEKAIGQVSGHYASKEEEKPRSSELDSLLQRLKRHKEGQPVKRLH